MSVALWSATPVRERHYRIPEHDPCAPLDHGASRACAARSAAVKTAPRLSAPAGGGGGEDRRGFRHVPAAPASAAAPIAPAFPAKSRAGAAAATTVAIAGDDGRGCSGAGVGEKSAAEVLDTGLTVTYLRPRGYIYIYIYI
jgi:hypothetical protein